MLNGGYFRSAVVAEAATRWPADVYDDAALIGSVSDPAFWSALWPRRR